MRAAALALVAACHGSSAPTPNQSQSQSPTPTQSPTPSQTPTPTPPPKVVTIDATGIGFDDLAFVNGRVLVPAGATGMVVLVNPENGATTSMRATPASSEPYRPWHHDVGVTSAAASYVATDRTSKMLVEVGGVAKIALASEPDYVRVVGSELWVTEPDAGQIEAFTPPPFKHVITFAVPGGPESLVVSPSRNMAYANLWHAKSVEIDVAKHAITRTFASGCDKTRGIALDDAGGGLFVACNDGRIVRIDLSSGKIAAEGRAGDGVDIIDFSPKTGHLYVPAARAGNLTVFDAKLSIVKTAPVPKGAHCVVADDRGQAWVCDPDHGSLVVFSENP